MTPDEQARGTREWLELMLPQEAKEDFIPRCFQRTLKDGAKYFNFQTLQMKFEEMSIDELYEYAEEELLDIANYAWMINERGSSNSAFELAQASFTLWEKLRQTREVTVVE
jgi:hypothetical protein